MRVYYYINSDGILIKSTKEINSPGYTSLTEEQYKQYLTEMAEEEVE